MTRRSPPPLLKGSGGLATAFHTTHQREKPEHSVYAFLCELCACMFTVHSVCESMSLSVHVNVCLRVSLETPFVSGRERKIQLKLSLEWEHDA